MSSSSNLPEASFGAVIARLYETIESRRGASPESSYTASLLDAGTQKCAQKFGEEAVETVIAAMRTHETGKAALTGEAADAIYHLMVLLASAGVTPDDVAAVLAGREGVCGHDEKAARKK